MFVVVSKWEYLPSMEDEVRASARKMMETINAWPEVEFSYNVRTGENTICAIIAYRDEPSYQRLIQDPDGPFAKAAAEHGIENHAKWLWSERGEVEQP
jgi:hypothetical protein